MESQRKPQFTAKHKRLLKLMLDAIMLVLLVLMYRKQVISIAFHEIGGLALIGLFVIHHLVNARWIASAPRRNGSQKRRLRHPLRRRTRRFSNSWRTLKRDLTRRWTTT